jgi:ferredoxin
MPQLKIEGVGCFDVDEGKKLVLAIEESGVDVMHACGGYARCTTCRVEFLGEEPTAMTVAERDKLAEQSLEGIRLSCQLKCDQDLHLRVLHRLQNTERPNAGGVPSPEITPTPEWI